MASRDIPLESLSFFLFSMIGIYKITSPQGRVYIGQSRDIKKRWSAYLKLANCKAQPRLYRSFKKYGVTNHTFEVVEECLFEEMNIRERYWQDYYNVLEEGLNCKLTLTDELPLVLSEDVMARLKLPKDRVICPHCGKVGGEGVMKQWHFDACKERPGGPIGRKVITEEARIKSNQTKGVTGVPKVKKLVGRKGPKSEEHKANMRGPRGPHKNPAPHITCPHCGKEGGIANMKRWHFDNCKK